MNAYELADKLEECLGYFGYNKSAAFMLRQQADRIAELEKEADRLSNHADELDEAVMKLVANDCFFEAQAVEKTATMLRQQAIKIAELEKELKRTKFAWNLAENEIERLASQKQSYRASHEGFSTIQEVIAKHEAIPSRKEAIDKAREWLKNYRIDAIVVEPFAKPLSDEEIIAIRDSCYVQSGIDEWEFDDVNFARAIEERHGIK